MSENIEKPEEQLEDTSVNATGITQEQLEAALAEQKAFFDKRLEEQFKKQDEAEKPVDPSQGSQFDRDLKPSEIKLSIPDKPKYNINMDSVSRDDKMKIPFYKNASNIFDKYHKDVSEYCWENGYMDKLVKVQSDFKEKITSLYNDTNISGVEKEILINQWKQQNDDNILEIKEDALRMFNQANRNSIYKR